MNIKDLQKEIHQIAKEHGWWEGDRNVGEIMVLWHSEISEAFEEWRNGNRVDEIYIDQLKSEGKDGKLEGVPIEMADIIIRVLDAAEAWGIDMELMLRCKIEYNRQRSFRHGGKLV